MSKNTKILNNEEIASFCKELGMITKAGMNPVTGINLLVEDTLDKDGKEILRQIAASCMEGNKLYEAIEATGVFPEYVVNLLKLGEDQGRADEVMESLGEYYDRESSIASGVKSAVTYPLIMIVMMVIIIIVLIVKVLPIFRQVYDQLGAELTPFAEKLMSTGSVLNSFALWFTGILAILVIAVVVIFRIPMLQKKLRRIMAKFPLTKAFFHNMAVGRFASGYYLGLTTGMETSKTLKMTRELVETDEMEKKIDIVAASLKEGDTFAEAIKKAEVFSNLYNQMVVVADKSGTVDELMKQISDHYESATDRQLQKILAIIEPTLVIALSIIVGVILLSVLLPLMGVMTSIG